MYDRVRLELQLMKVSKENRLGCVESTVLFHFGLVKLIQEIFYKYFPTKLFSDVFISDSPLYLPQTFPKHPNRPRKVKSCLFHVRIKSRHFNLKDLKIVNGQVTLCPS